MSEAIAKMGMGVASFSALLYFGYRLLEWLEAVRTNHLPHIQESLDKLTELSHQSNQKLDEQTVALERLLEKP